MRKRRGFTLIEVVITVAIVSLLASAALPMAEVSVKRDKERDLRSALLKIRDALDAYKRASDGGEIMKKVGESGYPKSLDILVDGVPNAKDPSGAKIFFLRRIPRDPLYKGSEVSPSKTWGLRSYASTADDPQPGTDVFDVYSLSQDAGLNGIPYRQW